MRKAKGAMKRGLDDLAKLTVKSQNRLNNALGKARKFEYTGSDLANDVFEQMFEVSEAVAGMLLGSDRVPVAFIAYRADNTAAPKQSSEMEFPDPLTPAQIGLLHVTDLVGPVVGGAQKVIPKGSVTIKIQPAAATKSTDYVVEVNHAIPAADAGVYRGVLADGGKLLAEIQVLATP
jgi:hypothetical protein